VKAAGGIRFVVVRSLADGKWTTTVRGMTPEGITVRSAERVLVSALDRTGRESEPVEAK
jgi:hypothetical protein